jgi:hypothetical protein
MSEEHEQHRHSAEGMPRDEMVHHDEEAGGEATELASEAVRGGLAAMDNGSSFRPLGGAADVASGLTSAGVSDPRNFVDADPAALAGELSGRPGEQIDPTDVRAWQDGARRLIEIPRPRAGEENPDA